MAYTSVFKSTSHLEAFFKKDYISNVCFDTDLKSFFNHCRIKFLIHTALHPDTKSCAKHV